MQKEKLIIDLKIYNELLEKNKKATIDFHLCGNRSALKALAIIDTNKDVCIHEK